jgi:hypothetical protein
MGPCVRRDDSELKFAALFEIRIRKPEDGYAAAAVTTCAKSSSRFDCER